DLIRHHVVRAGRPPILREAAAEVRADERPRLVEVLPGDCGLDEAHGDPARVLRERRLDELLRLLPPPRGAWRGCSACCAGRALRCCGAGFLFGPSTSTPTIAAMSARPPAAHATPRRVAGPTRGGPSRRAGAGAVCWLVLVVAMSCVRRSRGS